MIECGIMVHSQGSNTSYPLRGLVSLSKVETRHLLTIDEVGALVSICDGGSRYLLCIDGSANHCPYIGGVEPLSIGKVEASLSIDRDSYH
mgnify:CR=1 FL=1